MFAGDNEENVGETGVVSMKYEENVTSTYYYWMYICTPNQKVSNFYIYLNLHNLTNH